MIAAAIMLWINYDIIVCSIMPIARSHSIKSTGYEVVSTIVSSYCLLPHNDGDMCTVISTRIFLTVMRDRLSDDRSLSVTFILYMVKCVLSSSIGGRVSPLL